MARLDGQRQIKLEPKRMQFAMSVITKYGYQVRPSNCGKMLTFEFKEQTVTLWVYSGWHSGKSIKDGRGLDKLIMQIKENPAK